MCAVRDDPKQGGVPVPAEVGIHAPDRPLAIMAEAPGAQEAATSRPLVGSAGRIFDALLADAGIRRDEIVILNRVRCRPERNNLKNAPEAIPNCDKWVVAELAAYDPLVVVVMGGTALQTVFGATAKVGMTRGTARSTGAADTYGVRAWLATYHPASLLPNRSPWNRPLVVDDLRTAYEMREELAACLS